LPTKDRTVTASLRISEAAYRALQDDARKQNISLNTIANQILVAYAEHDRYLKKYGMLKIGAPTFAQILNSTPDEAIVEAGRLEGTGIIPSVVVSISGELSVSSILEGLRRVGTYSNLWDYSEISHAGKISVTMAHDFGAKGSLLAASFIESLFKSVGKQIKVTQLRDSVTFEV
jgi:hypothetical protein